MDDSSGEEVSAGQSKADTTEVGQNYICGLPKGKEGFGPLNSGSPFFAQTALPIMETNIMRGDLYEQTKVERKACHLGGYLKLCGICYIISMLFGMVWYIAFFEPTWYQSIKGKTKKLVSKLKRN